MTTNFDQIPAWDNTGLLPPYVESATSPDSRSPYQISLVDMILRFGNTNERLEILEGFLDFRAALRLAGLVDGFQWINGSFVEDTSRRDPPEPDDIDVVTFFQMPADLTEQALVVAHPRIFDPRNTKARYRVDSYPVILETDDIRV